VKEFHYMGPARAVSVEVDPDGKIPLDVRPANNSFTLEPETTPFAKAMVTVLDWCEDVMTMCAFF
jgi:hypothetical protein